MTKGQLIILWIGGIILCPIIFIFGGIIGGIAVALGGPLLILLGLFVYTFLYLGISKH